MSGDSLPADLRVMKDIKTRLSLAAVFKLEELNDEFTMMVIDRQMSERNLKIDLICNPLFIGSFIFDYFMFFKEKNFRQLELKLRILK